MYEGGVCGYTAGGGGGGGEGRLDVRGKGRCISDMRSVYGVCERGGKCVWGV